MTDSVDGWIPAGDYFLRLEDGQIIARNAKGKTLKAVPAKVKKTPEFEQLTGLVTVLAQHDEECADSVRGWFLGGHSIPIIAVQQVWPDPIWRKYLENLVVTDGSVVGLLRGVTETGLAIVDLDGESVTLESETISIPHPAVIEDIDDWREFASELGAQQGIDQLFREIHLKPADAKSLREQTRKYQDGKFEQASHLTSRGRSGGFRMNLYSASVDVAENNQMVTALLELDAYDPFDEAQLGVLRFNINDVNVELEDVGPIAWSEGIRMCEYLYAGRKVENAEEN